MKPAAGHVRERLGALMGRYRTDSLAGVSPAAFRSQIEGYMALDDGEMEGFADTSLQRDISVRFTWGHDHDFGDWSIRGMMRDRHLNIISRFVGLGALPEDLSGRRVLDIGCWTGGSSLLMAAMGAEVVALEEVRKYAAAARFLAESFAASVRVFDASLYDTPALDLGAFDYVLFSGVLYHVSDPVLALRILFSSLLDGGACCIETAAIAGDEPLVRYAGPRKAFGKDGRRINWNWFVPTLPALRWMIEDVGFVVESAALAPGGRAYAIARRERHVDMLRAGLSNRRVQ